MLGNLKTEIGMALIVKTHAGKGSPSRSLFLYFYGCMLCLMLVLTTQKSYATHAAGAELTYSHISGNDYRVVATFYRDCGGVAEPASIVIKYRSASLGISSTVVAIKDTSSGQEITVSCSTVTSTCNGGTAAGVRKFVYVATLSLPQNAADWIFSFYVCCRNCSITTITNPCASNSLIYVEAFLNSLDAPGNNSPVFSNLPVVYICMGQNFTYNHGVIDVDGDSLAYELVTPLINDSTTVTFISPNSANSPVQSSTPFTLDVITGAINFTPMQQQIGIFAFRVKEFRNGICIGSVTRDMQVYTIPCLNNLPTASGINSSPDYYLSICANSPACFTIHTEDIDSLQTVTLATNIAQTIPGASWNISPGNRPVLNFCWTPTTAEIRSVPYTFTVTVRDNACPGNGTQTFTYRIYVSGPHVITSVTNASCNGGIGGSALVQTVNSGICTYLWNTSPVQTTALASNLSTGLYSVVVTDSNGCSVSQSVTIMQASLLNISGNITPVSCPGQTDGAVQLTVSGGTSPYSYAWSNGSSGSGISALPAGVYAVTVTDSNNCFQSQTFAVQQQGVPMQVSVEVQNQRMCNANETATIELTVNGGNPPLVYQWNNGSVLSSLVNIHAGSYSCFITDANGCSIGISPVLIQQPLAGLSTTISSLQNSSCSNLNSGAISTLTTGGFPPYSFLWSTNSTTADLTALSLGAYTLTVTDSIGCEAVIHAFIEGVDSLLEIHGSSGNIRCFGTATGSISVSASGGTAPYSYAWTSGATVPSLTQLPAGNYKVLVTDASGCSRDSVFVIEQPVSSLVATVVSQPVSCYGDSNASIDVSAQGGTPPYQYLWNNNATTSSITHLVAGNYAYTITDDAGCVVSDTLSIAQPSSPLLLTSVVTNSNCLQGIPGSILVTAVGGTMPYSYSWNNGLTTPSLSGLSSGHFQLTVSDAQGCSSILERTVQDFSLVSLTAEGPTEICIGDFVRLKTDSMESSTYQWYLDGQTLSGAISPSFITPAAGSYSVAVTNSCGTYISNPVDVKVNSVGNYYVSPNVIICPSSGETTTLAAFGGAYYRWNPGYGLSDSTAASPLASPQVTTHYSVQITSGEGCTASGEVIVTVLCDSIFVPSGFSPDGDMINDTYVIKGIENYNGNNLFIYNRWGNLVYKKKNYNNSWDGTSNVSGIYWGRQLPDGTYFYVLDLNDGKKPVQGFIVLKK